MVHKLGRIRIPLPRPEDLVVMKAIAHRPRDAADIEALLDAHEDLDMTRIVRIVDEFASVLEAPELLTDLERILRRAPSRPPTRRPRPSKTGVAPTRSVPTKRSTTKKAKVKAGR